MKWILLIAWIAFWLRIATRSAKRTTREDLWN